jgi:hypothetical protein
MHEHQKFYLRHLDAALASVQQNETMALVLTRYSSEENQIYTRFNAEVVVELLVQSGDGAVYSIRKKNNKRKNVLAAA